MELLGDTIEEWLAGRIDRQEIGDTTAAAYRRFLDDLVDHIGPATPLQTISQRDLEGWVGMPRKDGRPYDPQARNTRATPMRVFFQWAHDHGIIPRNPAKGIKRAKRGRRHPKGLAADDVARLLWVSDFRTRTIVLIGVHLGLRRAELHAMDLQHWDRRDRLLYVVGKGDKERTLPLGDEVTAAMRIWADLGLGGRRVGPFWPSDQDPAGRLSLGTIGRTVRETAEVAQVDASTHSLRHTCATDLTRAGVPMNVVQAWMGHEDVATTGLYATATASDLRAFAGARSYLPDGLGLPEAA